MKGLKLGWRTHSLGSIDGKQKGGKEADPSNGALGATPLCGISLEFNIGSAAREE
jgi:hypothetical protein